MSDISDPPTPASESGTVVERSVPPVLPPSLAACLACLVPLIGGLIFLSLEKRNTFVRFWAMQSVYFGGAMMVIGIVLTLAGLFLGAIPLIGWLLAFMLGLIAWVGGVAMLVVYVVTIIKSISGVEWEIPYLGPLVRKQLANDPPA